MNWKCKFGLHDWAFGFHPFWNSNGPIPDLRKMDGEELGEFSREAIQMTKVRGPPEGHVPMRICERCQKVDLKIQLEILTAMTQSSGEKGKND